MTFEDARSVRLSDGCGLRCWTAGSGSPVLLIAGTGYPGRTWEGEFVRLLASAHQVIIYDHRGTGGSDPATGALTTRALAEDVAGLINALELPSVHVIGHSMGGRVAQHLALTHPELLRSLVLAASGNGSAAGPHQPRGVPPQAIAGLMELGYEGYVRDLQRRTFFTEEFVASSPDVVGALGERFWYDRPPFDQYLRHVEARQSHDLGDEVARINVPTLVLVGELDTHVGGTGSHFAQSEQLHALIPGSRFEVVPGARHGFFWEKPVETHRAIAGWISAVEAGRSA